MDEILDYIENNLKRDLTLVELSQRYHCSVMQLYYCLYDITGMPIMTYIRKRKLVNAAREIAMGRKMYDVAVDYGFETQAGFYKAFIQCIGCTPSEFQNHQQLREAGKLDAKILAVREEWKSMEEIVNPAFQRQGIGKRLCQESLVYAKQMGCDHIIASCRNDGAEFFYRAIGMEQCGRIAGGILEPWGERKTYDEIIFYKGLSD